MPSPTQVRRWCQSPGTGVMNGCEPPCGCWELDPDPLEEQTMLLSIDPSLQPCPLSKHNIYIHQDLEKDVCVCVCVCARARACFNI